jgi:hypothetical protein
MRKQLQLNRLDIYLEQKTRINLIDVFRLFIWDFSRKEIPEGEVTVHNGVLILDFNAVLVHARLLMMTKKARKLSHDAVSCG